MSTETIVQTSSSAPAFELIAEQIIAITSRMHEDSHDQETIRTALHAFSQAAQQGNCLQPTPVAIGSSRGNY
jgi:hypothetical protein